MPTAGSLFSVSRLVRAGLVSLVAFTVVNAAAQSPGSSWVQKAVNGPAPRSGSTLAYDPIRENSVLFGGSTAPGPGNDTWTWNGSAWTQQAPPISPAPREEAMTAYSPSAGNVVLFGGLLSAYPTYGADTWTWNGSAWTARYPAMSPSGRYGATMARDADGNVILFGGRGSSGVLSDTWIWNGSNWTQTAQATHPPGRQYASMAFNETTGKIVLFGGTTGNGAYNDTWTWDGTTWTQQAPATSPGPRFSAATAYDAATGTVILYGGTPNASTPYNDTWSWDGTTWTQLNPGTDAGGRARASAAYDAKRAQVVLFGNITPYTPTTFVLSATNFTAPQTAVGAAAASTPVYFNVTPGVRLGTPQVLFLGAPNLDFTLGTGSTCTGVVSGQTCVVNVLFKPRYPGQRLGAVNLTNSTGTVIATANISGIGTGAQVTYQPGTISTLAGIGGLSCFDATSMYGPCGDGGRATNARVGPVDAATDGFGNIYLSDYNNNRIRKIDTSGIITSVAGTGYGAFSGDGGPATAAQVKSPSLMRVDGAGNLYFADGGNYRVRKISAATGIINTVAGNGTSSYAAVDGASATASAVGPPSAVAFDAVGSLDFTNNGRVLQVRNGQIRSIAGGGASLGDGGPATAAQFSVSLTLTTDSAGNIYIGDGNANRLRKITAATGLISTVFGNGNGTFTADGNAAAGSSVRYPYGVAVDAGGNIYVAEYNSALLRKIDANGIVSTLAGQVNNYAYDANQDGGPATSARIDLGGISLDSAGNLLLPDASNKVLRMVSAKGGGTFPTATAAGTVDTADGTKTLKLNNIGNANLNLTSQGVSSTNFQLMNPMSGGCSPTGTVTPGTGCTIGVQFNPQNGASGVLSGAVNTTSNAAVTTPAPIYAGSTAAGTLFIQTTTSARVPVNGTVSLVMIIGYPGPVPTGNKTVTIDGGGANVSAPTCNLKSGHYNCAFTYTANGIAPGNHTIVFGVAADGNYAQVNATGTLTVY